MVCAPLIETWTTFGSVAGLHVLENYGLVVFVKLQIFDEVIDGPHIRRGSA